MLYIAPIKTNLLYVKIWILYKTSLKMYFLLLSKTLKLCISEYRALSQEIPITTTSFRGQHLGSLGAFLSFQFV